MRKKVHFHDQHGAICGSEKVTRIQIIDPLPLSERANDVRVVTCVKCARKLKDWGFGLQSFSSEMMDMLVPARVYHGPLERGIK